MIGLLCLRRSYKYDRIHYVFGSSVPLCVRVYAYVRASVRPCARWCPGGGILRPVCRRFLVVSGCVLGLNNLASRPRARLLR